MRNPPPPRASRRTCPACGRPAEPGNKFCATCGTWIPVLLTCSKCGTQFIHPYEHCDLCGAPLIPQGEPEPGNSAGHREDEIPKPFEDRASGLDGEEIPGPDLEEVPDDQKKIVSAMGDQQYYKKEISEPDTDELLEKYGKEYAEDETLESYHTPKTPSLTGHETKKPVIVPPQSVQESSETLDDALFLSPKKPESPTKRPGKFTWIIAGCIAVATIVGAVYFIGLPMLTEKGGFDIHITPPVTVPTGTGTITPSLTVTLPPSSNALVPRPTQLIPTGQKFHFLVQKNPVTLKITVTFLGSADSDGIQSADIKVSHPDGSFATGIIQPLKGVAEVELTGSNQTDRVEILAHMSNGITYRVYDQLVQVMGS